MKTKQSKHCLTWIMGCWLAVALTGWAGSQWGASNLTTVDTRGVNTGSLTGLIQGGGKPVANAQARMDGTVFTATTGADGRFTLANVPVGSGYLLKVSAAGFATKSVPGITVTGITKDLGTILLSPMGPHKVITLVPDLNPAISVVEEGGVAYRYYWVVSADGKNPAGGVTLQARLAGGSSIPQTGDVSENWPGREAGVSDGDGIVRIGVPSSAVGSAGTTRKVEVLDAGLVVQSFDISVQPFKYEKVWGHSIDGSVGGKLYGVKVEPGGSLETEVKDYYKGGVAYKQTIERTRSLVGKAGLEASVGSFKLGSVKGGATAGFGGYMDLQWSGKWQFNPDEYNGILNMEKVYFAFGDIICLGPLGSEFYGKLSDYWYGPGLQDTLMTGSGGEVHMGGYFDGEAGFSIVNAGNVNVRLGAELDGSVGGFLGYERSYIVGQIQDHTILFGFESEMQGGVGATAAFGKYNGDRLRGIGVGLDFGAHNKLTGRVQNDWTSGRVQSASVELENQISGGGDVKLYGWKDLKAPIGGDEGVKISESYTLTFSGANSYDKLASLGKLWAAVRPGSGTAPLMNKGGVDSTSAALADAAEASGQWTTYERSAQRTYKGDFSFPIGANTLAAALELDFSAEARRGATMVLERGVAPGGRLFPQEYQPDRSRDLIPADKIFDKELVWLSRAEFPPTSGFSRFAEYVSTANPNLTIGDRFSMFFSDVSGGAQIVGSSFVRMFGANTPGAQKMLLINARPLGGLTTEDYLPEVGQTNYTYGVSGLLQLTPGTNAFPGTATLVMLYSPDQVSGLNAEDLRIYRLPDGTNQWQLIGGNVNLVSNSVTAVINNFGTYAIAPPMPSGTVNMQATNFNLIADGKNEFMLIATNLLLNTGGAASNSWLFTVDAQGIDLLDADVSTNWTGVQVASTNGVLHVHLRAPVGGTYASVNVSSVAGDARGNVGINLIDDVPPAVPANVLATAGQSRVWVSWQTNSEPDLAGYRVYYRMGTNGPPWDGTATVEGSPSPVTVTGTNCLLRGLTLGTNYFVAVSAVDSTGNESLLSPSQQVTTTQAQPATPTAIMASFGVDGTNILMWALSEDDGYNDRDVVRYEVWRAVMPGGSYIKLGEVEAGIGLFSETNTVVGATQYVAYAISAVDASGLSSGQVPANRVSSVELRFGTCQPLPGGEFQLTVYGEIGRGYVLQAATDLTNWIPVLNFTCTNAPHTVVDSSAATNAWRFYRVVTP